MEVNHDTLPALWVHLRMHTMLLLRRSIDASR